MDGLRESVLDRVDALRFPDGRVTAVELEPLQGVHWAGRGVFGRFPNTAVYPPGLYLPQAIGWRVGEAENLTILHTLLLARLLTMICAVGIGWLALRLCGQGRWLLFACLLLPTVLNLGASCSQDALLLPIAGLAMVLLLRAIEAQRALGWGEMVLLALLLTLCIGARLPYLPMALVLLLPALEGRRGDWLRWVQPLAGILLVACLVGAWQMMVHPMGVVQSPEANPALQTAFLRAHPLQGCLSLFDAMFDELPVTMVKGLYMLGFNDAGAPHAVYGAMALGLVGIGLLSPMAGLKTRAAKAVLLVALVGTIAAVWLAEYLFWTAPGTLHVGGLQSRYFLPLMPFVLLLGWQWGPGLLRRFLTAERMCERVRFAAAAMFLAGVFYAPWAAARVFYLSGPATALHFLLR
jgi:uncharacterized membrane protein